MRCSSRGSCVRSPRSRSAPQPRRLSARGRAVWSVGRAYQLPLAHLPVLAADRLEITEVEVVEHGVGMDRDRVGREVTVQQLDQPDGQLVPGIPGNLHADDRTAIAQQEATPLKAPAIAPIAEIGHEKGEGTLAG